MPTKNPHNKERLANRIGQDIGLILKQDFSDPRLHWISITHVELSNDKSWAKVYWDTFDTQQKENISMVLESIQSKIRKKLSQVLNVRHTPTIQFIYNSQYESEQKIAELLKK